MKQLKFLMPVVLLTVIFCSCSGNNNKKTSSSDDKSTAPSSTSVSSSGNASWSAVIDGQPVSGGSIDNGFQQPNGYQSNVAYADEVDNGKELLFYLTDPKSTSSPNMHSLRFSVPDKAGNSSFGAEENGWDIEVDIFVNKDHTARYNSDSFTINITNLSDTRVSGTFSGKFSLNGNINDTDKKEIEISDGKFDIPSSK